MFTAATVPTPVVSSSVMFRYVRIANVVFEFHSNEQQIYKVQKTTETVHSEIREMETFSTMSSK